MSLLITVDEDFDTYRGNGSCSTRNWQNGIEWSRDVRRLYTQGYKLRVLIDTLIRHHARKLPPSLKNGQAVMSMLENALLPDNLHLMTACGAHAAWEPVRKGPTRLHTLIGFPSSF